MGTIVKMENNGLGSTQSKKQQSDLEDRIRVAQIDHDFYTAGLPFSNGVSHSANHLYGNGKWKKTIIELFGEDGLKQYGSYFGNKPVDFPLVAFDTTYARFFNPGEKIIIKDKTGLYHDVEAKVITVKDKKLVMLAVPFKPGADLSNGVLLNKSRIKGSVDAIARFKQMDADHKGLTTTAQKKVNITETPEIRSESKKVAETKSTTETTTPYTKSTISSFANETVATSEQTQNNTSSKSGKKALIVFVLALLAIGTVYVIYTNYKPKNN